MSTINAEQLIERLENMAGALPAFLRGLCDDEVTWKPNPGEWSILEVCCHLADEENEDFRPRLQSTLTDPSAEWPPLDLEGVAERRGYNSRDLIQVLDHFATARRANALWLRSLESPDWERAHTHPKLGAIRAGDLLAAWAAHDAIHIRQISKRLLGLALRDSGMFSATYAQP
ncbi:DinB family protein [Candidatus Sumerlaeota bacterium]|nr:DinB family protein [Candidatus Sumerlaeota bacterium]